MAKTNSVRVYSISRVSSSMQTIQLFEVKAIFGLESTIPEGWLAEWPACLTEKLGIEPVTAQLELGLGLSLAIMKRMKSE